MVMSSFVGLSVILCLLLSCCCRFNHGVTGNVPVFSPGRGPVWAHTQLSSNYELLCRDGTRAPVSQWKSCHLVRVPFRGIVVRTDVTPSVVFNMLTEGLVRQKSYIRD